MRERQVTQAFLPPAYVQWIDEDPAERLAGSGAAPAADRGGIPARARPAPDARGAARPADLLRLRPDRGDGLQHRLHRPAAAGPVRAPSAGRCPTPACTCWTTDCARCRSGWRARSTSAARAWLAAISAGPTRPPSASCRTRSSPASAMYRTGDLARWLPDGNASYVGRARQPGQAARLPHRARRGRGGAAALPGVREAAVLADRERAGGPRLVAAVGLGQRDGHADAGRVARGPVAAGCPIT